MSGTGEGALPQCETERRGLERVLQEQTDRMRRDVRALQDRDDATPYARYVSQSCVTRTVQVYASAHLKLRQDDHPPNLRPQLLLAALDQPNAPRDFRLSSGCIEYDKVQR